MNGLTSRWLYLGHLDMTVTDHATDTTTAPTLLAATLYFEANLIEVVKSDPAGEPVAYYDLRYPSRLIVVPRCRALDNRTAQHGLTTAIEHLLLAQSSNAEVADYLESRAKTAPQQRPFFLVPWMVAIATVAAVVGINAAQGAITVGHAALLMGYIAVGFPIGFFVFWRALVLRDRVASRSARRHPEPSIPDSPPGVEVP